MTRMLAKTVAILVIALAPIIGAATAEAHGGDFGGGSFHAGVFTMEGFTAAVSVEEDFATGGFRGDRFRFGGFFGGFYPGYYGGYYPGYYGYGACYLTVYGTSYCY